MAFRRVYPLQGCRTCARHKRDPDVAAAELNEADVSAKESAAREHLNTGGKPEALRAALANPPLGASDGPLKDRVAKCVMDVFSAFKADELRSAWRQ